MGMDEWGKATPPCNCALVQKYGELLDAVKAYCIDCKNGSKLIQDCTKCALLKFS